MFYQDNLIAYKTSKMPQWKFIIPQKVIMEMVEANTTGKVSDVKVEAIDLGDGMEIPEHTRKIEHSDIKVDVRQITGKQLEKEIKLWDTKGVTTI